MFCLIQVRDLFDNRAEARTVSRRFLKNLPVRNQLKPAVWAECRKKPVVYVLWRFSWCPTFCSTVVPIYTHTKLRQLPNVDDVIAFTIEGNDAVKQPCITCQC